MIAAAPRSVVSLLTALLVALPAVAMAQYGAQHFGSKYSTPSYTQAANPFSRGPSTGTLGSPTASGGYFSSPYPTATSTTSTTMPRASYSDYYSQQLRDYRRPNVNPRQYTFDTYYYQNPSVSPYVNLMRRGDSYVNNYYQYVLPEQQRRAAAGSPGFP